MRTNVAQKFAATAALAALSIGALAGCGSATNTVPTTSRPTSSSGAATVPPPSPVPAPTVTESNPPGDIPDNQVFVPYRLPGTGVSVKVPEGWSRAGAGQDVTFTDKLNSIRVLASSAGAAPTVASVKAADVPALKSSVGNFTLEKVTSTTRKAGEVVLLTYLADSAPNAVTGKVVREAVERYSFFAGGTRVDLTLSGPKGADNVDPWRIVSDSVTL